MNIKHLPLFSLLVMMFLMHNITFGQVPVIKEESINFTDFVVYLKKNVISIDWITDNLGATNYFEVQKSADGKNFKSIALIFGPDPKQKSGDHYGCFDKFNPEELNHSFYRIKHIDSDGFEQFSDTRIISKKLNN